jgi:hypothetical protein
VTTKEIDAIAKKKAPLPGKPTISERGLHAALISIYADYDANKDTDKGAADKSKQAKQAAIEEYEHLTGLQEENAELSRRISQHIEIFQQDDRKRVALAPLMAQANKIGCALCKEIARVYDGREIAKERP